MYDAVLSSVPVATSLTDDQFKSCIDVFALGAVGSFIVVLGIGLIAYLILRMFTLFRG